MRHFILFTMTAIALTIASGTVRAGSYPIIAFGTRTYVAETTERGTPGRRATPSSAACVPRSSRRSSMIPWR